MSLFPFVLFFHVLSAIGLFAALALEWASLRRLARATTYEQGREWAGVWSALLALRLPAILVVLASGIYLAVTLGPGIWTETSLASGAGPLSGDLVLQLRHPLLIASWRLRARSGGTKPSPVHRPVGHP